MLHRLSYVTPYVKHFDPASKTRKSRDDINVLLMKANNDLSKQTGNEYIKKQDAVSTEKKTKIRKTRSRRKTTNDTPNYMILKPIFMAIILLI